MSAPRDIKLVDMNKDQKNNAPTNYQPLANFNNDAQPSIVFYTQEAKPDSKVSDTNLLSTALLTQITNSNFSGNPCREYKEKKGYYYPLTYRLTSSSTLKKSEDTLYVFTYDVSDEKSYTAIKELLDATKYNKTKNKNGINPYHFILVGTQSSKANIRYPHKPDNDQYNFISIRADKENNKITIHPDDITAFQDHVSVNARDLLNTNYKDKYKHAECFGRFTTALKNELNSYNETAPQGGRRDPARTRQMKLIEEGLQNAFKKSRFAFDIDYKENLDNLKKIVRDCKKETEEHHNTTSSFRLFRCAGINLTESRLAKHLQNALETSIEIAPARK